jgi:hemerythrin superfamily protein
LVSSQYNSSCDCNRKQELANNIIKELCIHASLEETLIYPVLRDRVPEGKKLADEAYEDHFRVERLLDELLNMKVADDESKFDTKLNTMADDLLEHIRQEEGQLLPLLRQYTDPNELVELGKKMETNRPLMPTHPHPNMPKEGMKGMVAGLAAAPLDRAYDAARSVVSGQ